MQLIETDPSATTPIGRAPDRLIVIGAGAGGPQALAQILPGLPPDLPAAVIVVQQMRSGFTRVLADHLNQICSIPIHEPTDGQAVQASRVLMVPAGCVLTVGQTDDAQGPGYAIVLEDVRDQPERLHRRTNDTMLSAAQAFGPNSVGVLLTGTGEDGAEGMIAIARADGATIAQDENSSIVFDLPSSAIRSGAAREVLPLWRISGRIEEIVMGGANAAAA